MKIAKIYLQFYSTFSGLGIATAEGDVLQRHSVDVYVALQRSVERENNQRVLIKVVTLV